MKSPRPSRLAAILAAALCLVTTPASAQGLGVWIDLDEDESYTARHECSFVQVGDKFILFGGRESSQTLDTYDYATDTWTTSASAPLPFNHFQATNYDGLLWVIGAFRTNNYPNETPAESVWVFDPANDIWIEGPTIPASRRRGGGGLVVYNDKFYMVGGNTLGHNGGYQPWLDEFDPKTGVWTPLADAPRARDHFHAVVVGDELYAIGGRRSGGPGGTFAPLIAEVDVYDFSTGTWSTLPPASNLPTPRAASPTAVFDGEIVVMGGEGNGMAYDTVEALDPVTEQWRTLAPMNHARHGTQAIVSGNGIYVTAGSFQQGGGNQKNMEVYDAAQPAGAPSVAGVLQVPIEVTVKPGLAEPVLLEHVAGNQGIYLESVSLSGADSADFALSPPVGEPFLLPVAGSRELSVSYTGAASSASASLDIDYSGGLSVSIPIAFDGALAECQDGIDNDGDGAVDFGGDPGCASDSDLSEHDPTMPCDDGVDNDGDGRMDFDPVTRSDPAFVAGVGDPSCSSRTAPTETRPCQDGANNDVGTDPDPGLVDFDGGQSIYGACSGGSCPPGVSDPNGDGVADPDPQCTVPWKAGEGPGGSTHCGLGFEAALMLPALAWLRRRRFAVR